MNAKEKSPRASEMYSLQCNILLFICFALNVHLGFYLLNGSESLRKGMQEHRIIVLL